MANHSQPTASMRKTILASLVALSLNGVWFLGQAMILRGAEPLSDSRGMSVAVPAFLMVFWFVLGFLILKGLRRTDCRAGLVFLVPPILFTSVLLGLHVLIPPNEFLSTFRNLWFISAGYFLGGFVAWQGARSP